MKRIVLLLFLALGVISMQAQVYVGGSFGFWYNDDVTEKTTFSISPEVGYHLNHKWALGVSLGLVQEKVDEAKATGFAIAPYARFSFYDQGMVRLFVDGGFGYSTISHKDADNTNGFEVGLKPGIALKLNDHFNLIGKIGFLGYRDDYIVGASGQGLALSSEELTFGFHYTF